MNYDKIVLEQLLMRIGRPDFMDAVSRAHIPKPKMSELYLELKGNSCYIMVERDYMDVQLMVVRFDDVPVTGWSVYGEQHRKKKG
ncbi:MAG: hypothetical protein WBG71_13250 [Leeuwenhoekiella sp.]